MASPIAVRELPADRAALRSAGSWQVIRVLIYPSEVEGAHRVTVALVKEGRQGTQLLRQEVCTLEAEAGLETPEDIAEFLIQALS